LSVIHSLDGREQRNAFLLAHAQPFSGRFAANFRPDAVETDRVGLAANPETVFDWDSR